MKGLLFFLLLTVICITSYAQKDPRDGRHVFNFSVRLKQCDFDGTVKPDAKEEDIPGNAKFVVRNYGSDFYVIQVPKFTSDNETAKALNTALEDKLFRLPISEYMKTAERLEKAGNFTVGAATTLIKIRPGKKDPKDGYNIYSEFGNDFNVGISAGWKFKPYRRTQLSYSFVGGLSFSAIKVTPYTTKNFLENESTQSCITFSLGFIFEYDKFQVSAFSGIDAMSGEVGRHWIYRNRPWIGLGLGYQIFRAPGEQGN